MGARGHDLRDHARFIELFRYGHSDPALVEL